MNEGSTLPGGGVILVDFVLNAQFNGSVTKPPHGQTAVGHDHGSLNGNPWIPELQIKGGVQHRSYQAQVD